MFKKITVILISLFFLPMVNAKTLLIVGDSISAGFGVDVGKSWVNHLDKQLKEKGYPYSVVNASISGDTTANGLARLPALLSQYHPDIVLIELGGNDGLRGTPLKRIEHNLTQMVKQIKESNAQALLIGIELPPNYGNQYLERFMAIYPSVAEEQQIPFVPSIVKDVGGHAEFMQADGVHPNVLGHERILDNIWPVLVPLLEK